MIPMKEMWHNGGKRLLLILIIISCVILLVVGSVALGIFVLDSRIRTVKTKIEAVAGNQEDISARVDDNTEALKDYGKAVNEGWKTFQDSNPTQPIPQVSESDPKADIVVIPAKSKPKPSATPKTRTLIKYKARPTPTPWTLFPNWLKRRP